LKRRVPDPGYEPTGNPFEGLAHRSLRNRS
jgi:hypothetical protein